jgi:hypothetical protein
VTADVVGWESDRCPNCQQQNSVPLLDGVQLCLACRHEWKPADTSGPVENPTFTTVDTPDVEQYVVPEMPPELQLAAEVARAREQFVGKTVLWWDENQEGEVEEVYDTGYVRVSFGGLIVDLLPDEFSLVATEDDLEEAQVAAIGILDLTAAALTIRAALDTIDSTGDVRRLGLPPHGWIPADAQAFAIAEHGAAYAVATLALTYGISNDQLSDIAMMLEEAAFAAKEATGQ